MKANTAGKLRRLEVNLNCVTDTRFQITQPLGLSSESTAPPGIIPVRNQHARFFAATDRDRNVFHVLSLNRKGTGVRRVSAAENFHHVRPADSGKLGDEFAIRPNPGRHVENHREVTRGFQT